MKSFRDAEQRAAEEIADLDCGYDGYVPHEEMQKAIAEAYAPIESTYGLLVELAKKLNNRVIQENAIHDASLPNAIRRANEAKAEWEAIGKLLADPQVRAAMEGK